LDFIPENEKVFPHSFFDSPVFIGKTSFGQLSVTIVPLWD